MRIKQVSLIVASLVIALLALASALTVLAGEPDSSAAPDSTYSYTLEHIYDRLDTGAATAAITFTEPITGPEGTMHTLNDIMGAAPAVDDANGATAADVSSDKTAWGLTSGAWGVITGTGTIATYAAAVPKTGQTLCYKDDGSTGTCECGTANCSSGQDGDLEKGGAWPSPRFTDNSDGTVTDNLTGLIWLQNAYCAEGAATWANALSYSNALYDGCPDCFNGHGDCGLSDGSVAGDWRLPNVREMQSLIHYGVYDPAVPNTEGTAKWATNGDPFDNVQSLFYWTSTTCASGTDTVWGVYLLNGIVYNDNKTGTTYVWPVRGGQ